MHEAGKGSRRGLLPSPGGQGGRILELALARAGGIQGHGPGIRVLRITHIIFKTPPRAALQLGGAFPKPVSVGRKLDGKATG